MNLDKLFKPDKIAVVGASRKEGKTGHEIFENLYNDFEGELVPVNPKASEIHGVKAEENVPEGTDLAVIAVPAKIVPKVMDDLVEKKVDAVIIVSAGFSETGNENLEKQIVEKAEQNDIALLGPNVLGLINTENSMNASFASKMPEEGDISFLSQSGAFCTAILDYAKAEHIGFRHFVSLGNKAMINDQHLLDYWKDGPTETILGYMEGVDDGREFIEAAKQTSKEKPIVMIKSGRTSKGGEAASSHTGSIAGSYQAYQAAFRKAGIIEAESNRELLDFGRAFNYQPVPSGGNVAIVTNAGGPGVLTTDEISQHGLELAEFSNNTKQQLEDFLPEEASAHNPLDVIGDADHERYRKALEVVSQEGNVDAIIVILTPQANTEIEKTAATVIKAAQKTDVPVMASFMGELDVEKGVEKLEEGNIPEFQDPVDAVKTIKAMKQYREFTEKEETFLEIEVDEKKAADLLENADKFEGYAEFFEKYGFRSALTKNADAPLDAVEAAKKVGYPVAMKVESPDVKHKTDIGAVKVGIESKQEVKKAYREIVDNIYHNAAGSEIRGVQVQEMIDGMEVALGLKQDPQFGPMVMVGLGGIYVEVFKDVSFGIAPISEQEAEDMIDELKSHELLDARGKEFDREALKNAIIRLGEIGSNHPEIQELDINPLILTESGAYIADIAMERNHS